jgi:translation initiation factor IF-2
MPKIRVHQLAKELDIDSKIVMDLASAHGIEVKNHMSALDTGDEFMLRAYLEAEHPRLPKPAPEAVADKPKPAAPDKKPKKTTKPAGVEAPPAEAPPVEAAAPAPPAPKTRTTREIRVRPPPAPEPPPVPEPAAPEAEIPVEVPAETATQPQRQPEAPPPPPPKPAERPAARTVVARPPAPLAPAGEPAPAAGAPGETPVVRPAARTVTATPRAGDPPRPLNPPNVVARRTGEILGRRDIAPRDPAQPPSRSSAGAGGSGLIVSRSEGTKRTFIMTGRGRAGQRPQTAGPHGPPGARGPMRSGPPGRGGRDRGGMLQGGGGPAPAAEVRKVEIQLPVTVKGLSEALGVKANMIIQKLFVDHGVAAKINDQLQQETVELLGIEFNAEITVKAAEDLEASTMLELEAGIVDRPEDMTTRAPIVTFLGHVDHGKTSLLDAIRRTNIAAKEHGGITQHIGASLVSVGERAVVFLDTPGHKAFTEMRARGAQVTDVVVLVVAADDGVMPQTKEAIAHARAAKVPIVVAVNKIDLPGANPMKVRQELTNEGLQPEEWGGKTVVVDVSAVKGTGIPQLLEYLALESDLLELKANPKRPAVGTVLEAEQSRGEGNMARLLVTNGTLKKGDIFVCGAAYGRLRAIKNDKGKFVTEAPPATPVEISGLNELPRAGDKFHALKDLAKAKELADRRAQQIRERELASQSHVSLEKLFEKLKGDALRIILKTDVGGSLEVLKKEIADLAHPEIRPEVIHAAVGGITDADVALADASDAIILGFHVAADLASRRMAEEKKVEIRIYHVIYKLIDELKAALEGKLRPEEKETISGRAEVKQLWKVSRIGTIAGCIVVDGTIKRSSKVRVSRGGIVLHDGELASLRRVKDDVREVLEGFECGLVVANFENLEVGDVIEAYEVEQVKRTLEG